MFLGPHIIFDYATAIVIFQVLMFPKLTVFERWAKFRWSHLYVYTLLSWRWIYTLLTCPWYGRAALRGLRDTYLSNVVYLSRYTNQPGSKAIVESEKFSTLLASRISTALVLSLVMVEAVYIILCTAQLVAAPVLLLLVVFPFAFRDWAAHGEVVDAELADFRGNPDEYKALWLEKMTATTPAGGGLFREKLMAIIESPRGQFLERVLFFMVGNDGISGILKAVFSVAHQFVLYKMANDVA